MFQRLGICWHTGYRYTHYKSRQEADNDLPAIKAMKNRVLSTVEKKEKENQYYV